MKISMPWGWQALLVLGSLSALAHAEPRPAFVPNEFVVRLSAGVTKADLRVTESLLGKLQIRAKEVLPAHGIYQLTSETPRSLVEMKRTLNGFPFEVVEPNYTYYPSVEGVPSDPEFSKQWGLHNSEVEGIDIAAPLAWKRTTGGTDVVVAVVDTGVDYTHPDLAPNIWINRKEAEGKPGEDDDGNGLVDDLYGYDFANGDADPMDDLYHGTHCAGIVGARGNNELGVVGVNWNVSILPIKFMNPTTGGQLVNAIKSIAYAANQGARVINASWGGGAQSQLLEDLLREIAKKGVLFVAAAGNANSNTDFQPQYPAAYKVENVLSVGALRSTGELAEFSNYGKRSVHLAAPGVGILSTLPESRYGLLSGTSMAAPFVSGVAALLLAQEPKITLPELRYRLIKRGKKLKSLKEKIASHTLLNAEGALSNQRPPSELDPDDPELWKSVDYSIRSEQPYANGTVAKYRVHVPGARRIALHFKSFDTEEGFDHLRIYDANQKLVGLMSGRFDDGYSVPILGDSAELEFTSDDTEPGVGFEMDQVAVEYATQGAP